MVKHTTSANKLVAKNTRVKKLYFGSFWNLVLRVYKYLELGVKVSKI